MQESLPPPVKASLLGKPIGFWKKWQSLRNDIMSVIPEELLERPYLKLQDEGYFITAPELIKKALVTEYEKLPKSSITKSILGPALGRSIFLSEGREWRWQRRTAAPVFAPRNIKQFAPNMCRVAEQTAHRIARNSNQAINFHHEMIQATLEIIADVTISDPMNMPAEQTQATIEAYLASAAKVSLFDMLNLPNWMPRLQTFAGNRILKTMRDVTDGTIAARRKSGPKDPPDLIDLHLSSVDPKTEKAFDDDQIRDNILTYIVAGHETTAILLSWALYLCAYDERVQQKLRDEIQEVLGNRAPVAEDLDKLPYTRMVIDETLRLYPPAPIMARDATEDIDFGDFQIKKKQVIWIPVYCVHRNKSYWTDPDRFWPERFEDRKAIERFSFIPFGEGPKICIGAQFAIQEAMLVLATLIQRFDFSAIRGKDPAPKTILTLRPEGGVWLMARPLQG